MMDETELSELFETFLKQHEGQTDQQLIFQTLGLLLSTFGPHNPLASSLAEELARRYVKSHDNVHQEYDT